MRNVLRKIEGLKRILGVVEDMTDDMDLERLEEVYLKWRDRIYRFFDRFYDDFEAITMNDMKMMGKIILFMNYFCEFEWSCIEKMTRKRVRRISIVEELTGEEGIITDDPNFVEEYVRQEKEKFWKWANKKQLDIILLREEGIRMVRERENQNN